MSRLRLVPVLTALALLGSTAPALADAPIVGPPGFQGDVSSPAAAAVRAHHLLAYLPLPSSAKPSKATALLPAPHDVPSQNRVVRSRWFTFPGTSRQLATYLAANVPDGFFAPDSGTGPHGQVHLSYATQAQQPAHAYLDVTYLPGTTTTRLRVDSEVIWLPKRSPLEHIPLTTPVAVLDVRPTFAHSGLPSRHLVYRGPDLGKLIPWFDFAPAAPPGQTGCPPMVDGWTSSVTFHLGHRVVNFSWYDGGCDVIRVTVNGKPAPALEYNPRDLVEYLVGLVS